MSILSVKKSTVFLCIYFLLLSMGCRDNKVECIGCGGKGVFTYPGGEVVCEYCNGEGKISLTQLAKLLPDREKDDEPIRMGSYCTFCMGTGKFRTNTFPFESVCSMCGGQGISDNPRNNTDKPLYKCVYCEGSGQNPFGGGTCTFCHGYGISLLSPSDQDRMSDRPRQSQSLCGACGGSGVCPACHSSGGVKYGEMRYCSVCGNTRRCPWCYGRGMKNY